MVQTNTRSIKTRVQAIRHRLAKQNASCLVVTKPANVTYTTDFTGDDSWALITGRSVYLLTDSRYAEQAEAECIDCKIIQCSGALAETVTRLTKRLRSIRRIAVEDSASLNSFRALKKNIAVPITSVGGVIETVRSTKDAGEVEAIDIAASIAAKAIKRILRHIKPGISENELAGVLDFQIRKLGAVNSFDTIVAFGPNGSQPHHRPSTHKLGRKDTVLIDFGVKNKGYCCDITRCFEVGRPTVFYKKVYDVVERSQAAAIRMVKDGADIVKVDAAARQVIRDSGFPVFGHGTGHGLGLEVHELPFLKEQSKGKLKSGQIITVEPGVYLPGKLGVRIEDDVLVTKTGCEVITRNCPHSILLPCSKQRFS
jgi:Xaa-Pro aminopeptidase